MVTIQQAIENVKRLKVQETATFKIEENKIISTILKALEKDIEQFDKYPLFFLLSGGLDSSLLVALSKLKYTRPIIGITIGSTNSPDCFYSRKVAQLFNITHFLHTFTSKEISSLRNECEKVFQKSNFKRSRGIGLALYILYKVASKYTHMVISGDGLDELAGGYRIHQHPSENINFWYPPVDEKEKLLLHIIKDEKRNIYEKQLAALEYTWKVMPETYLLYMKKYAEEFNLEVRLPYLDEEVISTLNKIPLEEKVDSREGKKIIKKLAKRYLPDEIIYRKKLGLPRCINEYTKS